MIMTYTVYLLINTAHGKTQEVKEDIVSVVKVKSIIEVWSAYDLIVELESEEHSEIVRKITVIRKIYNIRTITTLFDMENPNGV